MGNYLCMVGSVIIGVYAIQKARTFDRRYQRMGSQRGAEADGAEVFADYLGPWLLDKDGQMHPSREILAGKFVGIYIGAHWDLAGKEFDRLLTELYHNVNGRDMIATFEVVYVSSDRTADEFQEGIRQRQFYSLPFDDLVRRKRLHQIFRAEHLPTFLLFSPSGERLSDDAAWVEEDPYGHRFPWRGKASSNHVSRQCIIN